MFELVRVAGGGPPAPETAMSDSIFDIGKDAAGANQVTAYFSMSATFSS